MKKLAIVVAIGAAALLGGTAANAGNSVKTGIQTSERANQPTLVHVIGVTVIHAVITGAMPTRLGGLTTLRKYTTHSRTTAVAGTDTVVVMVEDTVAMATVVRSSV